MSSLDAARTRNDRRARDRRVRDTIAPPVRADATLAVPIGAVAILSVHVMNLAARLLGSSDGLDTIYSGGMHCGTTRTTSGEARAGPRALECGSLGDRFSDYFIQVSTLWLAGGERRWKTFSAAKDGRRGRERALSSHDSSLRHHMSTAALIACCCRGRGAPYRSSQPPRGTLGDEDPPSPSLGGVFLASVTSLSTGDPSPSFSSGE